ncbi:unnamed protein product [Didymodactylos carnosus]|uniref:ADP ribosyltransferase domain-containing protein n=1 Tax=Didymodactylos carnosus TaxID=1234261 RepID=A0A8S2ECD0_9BILA|nr:unnamed protein product [Didymodactylos carnosus]CAF3981455.1 unnamed protein product [Didymodactylos carnosus]
MGPSQNKLCPADELTYRKKSDSMSGDYQRGNASDFYFACRNGNIDYVLEKLPGMSIEDINKVEPNGSTAIHAATFYNHIDIVQELFKAGCSRTIYNNHGNRPYEEAQTEDMKKLYDRSSSTRFHEQNVDKSYEIFTPEGSDENSIQQKHHDYIQMFKSDAEMMEYMTNRQTMVMWLKFFDWFSHKFSYFIDRNDYQASLFDLDKDRDLDEFLRKDDNEYENNKRVLQEAKNKESVGPLITLYTQEAVGFYRILNEQLALMITSNDNLDDMNGASSLCDRFVREFDMREDELQKYKNACKGEKRCIIATKTFQSTSRSRDQALAFATKHINGKGIIFVFDIRQECSTVFDVQHLSEYPQEEEILILPGNLFEIMEVIEAKEQDVTEIHLRHLKIKISFFEKLKRTIKAARTVSGVD